jgi:hypothetical protein
MKKNPKMKQKKRSKSISRRLAIISAKFKTLEAR